MKVTPEEAREILGSVGSERYFKVHLGTNITNLHELEEALDIMSDESFNHHVKEEKNDFMHWIKDCIGDNHLAREIKHSKNRKEMLNKIKRRIKYLEKKVDEGRPLSAQEWMKYGQTDFVLGIVVGFIVGIIISIIL